MTGPTSAKQVPRKLLTGVLGVAACVAMAAQPALAEDGSAPAAGAQAGSGASISVAPPESATGMKGYIDPQTGAIRPDPAPGTVPLQLSPAEQNAMSTSDEGMTPVPNTIPGGGLKIDFKGRFQSPLIATIDENGTIRTHHPGETPVVHGHK